MKDVKKGREMKVHCSDWIANATPLSNLHSYVSLFKSVTIVRMKAAIQAKSTCCKYIGLELSIYCNEF